MFATIQGRSTCGKASLYHRVYESPDLEHEGFRVYRLVDMSVNNDIIKTRNGNAVGVFRHLAIDASNTLHLFDPLENGLRGILGFHCEFLKDSDQKVSARS